VSEIEFPYQGGDLPGLWDAAADAVATCVIAHGANNDMRHPFYTGIAASLVEDRVSALRFDFPYKAQGRSYPDRPPVLLAAWRGALDEALRRNAGLPVVASGKSLGGRMASMLAAEDGDRFAAQALVFFGYPLHAPGRTDQLRVEHLHAVTAPMLFIEGTADPLAKFDLIQDVVSRLAPRARLHVVEGGDHSFRVRGRKRPDGEIGRELGEVAAGFIREEIVA
jgi:uncharacterized protein